MKHGLVLPNWEAHSEVGRLVEAGVAAEEAGWDGVFLADHLIFPPPAEVWGASEHADFWPMADPWTVLAAIAARTDKVTLGTWVTPVGRRQPWQVAKDLATLDRLSGGRVILGAGLGRRPDYEQFGQPSNPQSIAERTDEALELIARLWTGERVTHQGAHYRIEDVTLLPTPLQRPRIPIVIGGLWPRRAAIRRGARWDGIMAHFPGDGVLPEDGIPPEQHARDMVQYYRRLTDPPGEIFLPAHPARESSHWSRLVEELGATWVYTAKIDGAWRLDLERIAQGPPRT